MKEIFSGKAASVFFEILAAALLASACSRDMAEQPSFKPMKPPRLHSPVGSVPQDSRSVLSAPPAPTAARIARGGALFQINCVPCHGKSGRGDGKVGRHLVTEPADLRSEEVQSLPASELYDIVTEGQEVMPSFKGALSAEERWAVAYFVKSWGAPAKVAARRQ